MDLACWAGEGRWRGPSDPKSSGSPIAASETHSWRNPSFPPSPLFSQPLLGISAGFQFQELPAEPTPAPSSASPLAPGAGFTFVFLPAAAGNGFVFTGSIFRAQIPSSEASGGCSAEKGRLLTCESILRLRNSLSPGDGDPSTRIPRLPWQCFGPAEAQGLQQPSQPAGTSVSCFQGKFPSAHSV